MKPQELRHSLFLFRTGDDGVHKAVVQQEFRFLKALGQFFPNGLLDDSGPGKTHGGPGLRQNDVALHGKAGRDPAGGGVGEHGEIKVSRRETFRG